MLDKISILQCVLGPSFVSKVLEVWTSEIYNLHFYGRRSIKGLCLIFLKEFYKKLGKVMWIDMPHKEH